MSRHRVSSFAAGSQLVRWAVLAVTAVLLIAPASCRADDFGVTQPFSTTAADSLMSGAATLPAGFTDTTVWSGLTEPTAIRWAPDGRVFVAEKTGRVEVFDNLADPTPSVYVDLSKEVDDFLDRGLLGLAIDPKFTTGRPYIYVLYTYDKDPNSSQFPAWNDDCPDPPGADGHGCTALGRLSRIDPDGTEHVLIQDWCIQYSTHSIGDLRFGPDGALYASGGDGASYTFADYGQDGGGGTPRNACGDPPAAVGGAQTPPTAEGGALRSQSFRRAAGEPVSLDGSIIRVDPDTGGALPDNPAAGDADANRRRIVAYGMRNPYRFTFRPGTNEIWFGDVGWNTWEEVNRDPGISTVRNFGWPCYEGADRMSAYDTVNLDLCESLYADGTATPPYFQYNHGDDVGSSGCPAGTSSVTGLAFYDATEFPAKYRNALFAADYARQCIMVMYPGADGLPDPATATPFETNAGTPVGLEVGPDGSLYFPDIATGEIHRISYPSGNHVPTASATATPDHGSTPLTVQFDGTASSDPDGNALSYSWDFNGDGTFGDSTSPTPAHVYSQPGNYVAELKVTDTSGASDVARVPITAGDPPTPTIDSPSASFTWAVGDKIDYSGHAVDGNGDPIPASGLSWQLNIRHCARTDLTNCHTHFGSVVDGVSSGSSVAPNHDWPSHLQLVLTATDANGLSSSTSVDLQPKTIQLTLDSTPKGAQLTMGADTGTAPFTETFIQNATTDITAPSPQSIGGSNYVFDSWSDGGTATHTITVPHTDTTITANLTVDNTITMAGNEGVGTDVSEAPAGAGEVYQMTAGKTGTITRLRLYLDGASTATSLTLGVYADDGGKATNLLGSGTDSGLVPDAWNDIKLSSSVTVVAGTTYWFALLNPLASDGTLKWRDHAGGQAGGEEQTSNDRALSALPGVWAAQGTYWDGPVSGYALGTTDDGSSGRSLSVAPSALSFSATAGAGSPAPQTLSVNNTGGGSLDYTASDDAAWLSVSPTSGTAPDAVTASVDTSQLSAGSYSGHITIDGGSAGNSPQTILVTLTVSPSGDGETILGGADAVGGEVSSAPVGAGEAYKLTASTAGPATKLRLYVDGGSAATRLELGLYADSSGKPASLLASGTTATVTPGAWNEVTLTDAPDLTAGTPYWFALLNPTGSAGTLRWRDHAGGATGGPEKTSSGRNLDALPATWSTLGSYTDGPVSGYVVGTTGPPPPPALTVSPSSLSFTATAGGLDPAPQPLSVSNSGGGSLSFTVSDDAAWLSETPASGSAPAAIDVSLDTGMLSAGTYTGHVTIDAGSAAGSPVVIPVTLTVNPPAPPALSVAPSALSFSATQGGAAPAAQGVSVSNAGGGELSYTASDDTGWLSETPASGSAPDTVEVSADPAGLAPGTYNGTVTIAASGVAGSPKTIAVSLTVTAPASGLVGAWGFDEAGGTTATDSSGHANDGTITGATRTTSGKFGGALTFNGTGDWVTVPDSASLDLTTGMTVEGWVKPSTVTGSWRAMAVKETATGLAWALYPVGDGGFTSGHAFTSVEKWAKGTAKLSTTSWSHVAVTYDGSIIRLYVNGTQVGTQAQTGPLATSSQPLRFGGDALWSEWFKGSLDEIRVYDRALTAAEIQADMNEPVDASAST